MKTDKLIAEATSLYKLGQLDQARNICSRILKLAPASSSALNMLAQIESANGNPDKALVLYKRSLAINPKQAAILVKQGLAQKKLGERDAAIQSFQAALALQPVYRAYLELGLHHVDADNLIEAEKCFQGALSQNSTCWLSVSNLSDLLAQRGALEEAARLVEDYIKIEKTNPHAYAQLTKIHLMNSRPEEALEVNAENLKIEPAYTRGFALKYVALSELGDKEGANYLYDYEKLVHRIPAKCPEPYSSIKDFNSALAGHIINNVQMHANSKAFTTMKGFHSGFDGIFHNNAELGRQAQGMVLDAANRYISNLSALGPDHPINTSRPSEYHILIWAVVTGQGGHELSHIHPKSWIGGAYYVELPEDFNHQPSKQAGWIEFGRGEEGTHPLREPDTRAYQPVEGDFLVFPGYFWHNTIPLESAGRRIVMAFDVQPLHSWGK